jgi:hypothetical protein
MAIIELRLTEERMRAIAGASERIVVREPLGNSIAVLDPGEVEAMRCIRVRKQPKFSNI